MNGFQTGAVAMQTMGVALVLGGVFLFRYSKQLGHRLDSLNRSLYGPSYPKAGDTAFKIVGFGALIVGPVGIGIVVLHLI